MSFTTAVSGFSARARRSTFASACTPSTMPPGLSMSRTMRSTSPSASASRTCASSAS